MFVHRHDEPICLKEKVGYICCFWLGEERGWPCEKCQRTHAIFPIVEREGWGCARCEEKITFFEGAKFMLDQHFIEESLFFNESNYEGFHVGLNDDTCKSYRYNLNLYRMGLS